MSRLTTIEREAQLLELEKLNSERRRFRLPEYAGFRSKEFGLMLTPQDGVTNDPIWAISGAADGLFYRDLREPHIVVDESAITITTAKALWAPARTILPANYWRVGKVVKVTAFGKATTGATPGNFTPSIAYGAGDNPTPIVSGVARAVVASVTNITWMMFGYVECRSIGATGTVRMWGQWIADLALQLSTNQPNMIPGSAPADTTIDTTVGTNAVTLQMARSGSTTETMTTTGLLFEALN